MERDRDQIEKALRDLPGGLPPRLSMYGTSTIVDRVVKARKQWSDDGRLIAFIQGDWYYVDPYDPGFMDVLGGLDEEGEAL